MWRRQFRRKRAELDRSNWYKGLPDAAGRDKIKARIAREGPLCSRDFEGKAVTPGKMWSRPPHKLALDYMWYAGELATCHREGFTKFYDLAERVFPEDLRVQDMPDRDQIDWLCHAALERMGFATPGEIQRFWDAVSRSEVQQWQADQTALRPVAVETAKGAWTEALAPAGIEARLEHLARPTARLRILNPFDR